MTKVINVKKDKLKLLGYKDFKHWLSSSPDHVYIGRNMARYVPGAIKSKWCNPFTVEKHGRSGCLKKYEEYIMSNKDLKSKLPELKGKVLGCWCKPEACHGDVLVKLVNKLEEKEEKK